MTCGLYLHFYLIHKSLGVKRINYKDNNMKAFVFQKPYPVLLNKWKISVFVSLFITLFLSIFQPFGLQFVNIDHKPLILAGYGMVTLLILLFDFFFIPVLFKRFFQEENWVVWKQIVWLTIVIVTISIGNYVYSILFSIVKWTGIHGFFVFVLFTFPIAVIPITVITFITQNIYLKRNLYLSVQMNKNIKEKSSDTGNGKSLSFTSGTQTYNFQLNTILFLESDGNYVHINYFENEQTKTQLIRNTLKNISEGIHEKELFKCHRAFMVNVRNVEEVKGNSHGISLKMKQSEKQIPVSRSNTKAFTGLLKSIKE